MSIVINNLYVTFGKFVALNNVSFEIYEKGITGIVGPNGAGKSTLLRSICGLLPYRGRIVIDGNEIRNFNETKSHLVFIPEYVDIYPSMKVREFINFLKRTTGIEDSIIEYFEINKVWNKEIGILSKGYKQRLKIVIGFSGNRKYVLLDEPFDGFDPIQIKRLTEFIRKDKRIFIMTVHNLSYAERICDYIVVLNNGKAVCTGYLEELKKKYKKDYLEDIFVEVIESEKSHN